MWAAIAQLVLGVVEWLFGKRQQAEGVAQGQAQQAAAGEAKELSDVRKAEAAGAAIAADGADQLRHDDGFRRDNGG